MNSIHNNPFRILGLPINATEREIAKQINTLATYAEMGKTKSVANDFPFLPITERTPDVIEDAKKQIEQKQNRFLYSLFWFWSNNSVDELALDLLSENKIDKAIEIWEKSIFVSKNKVYKSEVLVDNLIRQSDNWSEQKNDDHSLTKSENEYIVERKTETSYSIPTVNSELNNDDNWIIDCDTKWIAGVDNFGYGIVFGRNNSSFFTFQISGNGQFTYSKFIDWSFNMILDWKETDAINNWSENHIQIKKIDDKLNFFINGVFVYSAQSEPFFGNNFGFKVTNNQKISFRNFKFSKLVEEEIYGEGINISPRNFSNIKNLSTLYLSLATNNGTLKLDYFNKGIALAKIFFSNDSIEDYSKLITGDRYVYNQEKTIHFYLSDLIDSLKNYLDKPEGISTSQLINSFSNFPIEAEQFLNNRYVAKQIKNIDNEIEKSIEARRASPSTATDAGKLLIKNTKSDIEYLKKVLGKNHYQYQTIADKLSLEIVQCGNDSFYSFKTTTGEIDYTKAIENEESYLHEYEYALNIAVTQRVINIALENLDSCKKFIKNKDYYTCWFCGKDEPTKGCEFKKTMYKENFRFLERVNYSYVEVTIPRCSKCKNFHRYDFNFSRIDHTRYLPISLIELAIDLVRFIFGNIFSFLIISILKIIDKSKADIKNTSNSTIKHFPAIQKRLHEGWKFSKPTA